jgi:hypothetical protein
LRAFSMQQAQTGEDIRRAKTLFSAKKIKPTRRSLPIQGRQWGWTCWTAPRGDQSSPSRAAQEARPRPCKEGTELMHPTHLRIYHGPQEEPAVRLSESRTRTKTVTVPLEEVLPLLADAVQSDRTWLRDFGDDEITISMDLYEVLLAYQHYRRRPSA